MLEGAQQYAKGAVGPKAEPARRRRARELAAAHPVVAWLTGLIALSTVVRLALAYWIPVPWIFADELTYSELAKSFAAGGSFAVRDVHGLGLGPLYPLLISPAYAVFESVPHAYLAAKAINSLVMSSAAVPAYFLARRLVGRPWAIVAAGLSLAVPSLVYTGMLMTENLFYPLFLLTVLGMVRALERPSAGRQLTALALIALALLTRFQAVALVPALVTAIVAVAVVDAAEGVRARPAALLRGLGAYAPTWLALAGGLGALAGWESLHHRSLSGSFGDAAGVWSTRRSRSRAGSSTTSPSSISTRGSFRSQPFCCSPVSRSRVETARRGSSRPCPWRRASGCCSSRPHSSRIARGMRRRRSPTSWTGTRSISCR